MKHLAYVNEIIRSSFGLWISSLFSAISGWNPGISFYDQKEAFFWLIELLLKNGKIKFIAPGADCYVSPNNPKPRFNIYDRGAQWQATPTEIINYLRERWPPNALEENDLDLLIFFYEMPGVIWINDAGDLVAA
jgi:hypothetical protein